MDLFGLQGHQDSLHGCDWVGMAIILAGRDHNSFKSTYSGDRIKLTSSGFRTGCTLKSQTPWLTNQKTALLGATKNTLLPVPPCYGDAQTPPPHCLTRLPRALIGSVFFTLKSFILQVARSLLFLIIIIGKPRQKKYKNLKEKMQLFNIYHIIYKIGLDWQAYIYFRNHVFYLICQIISWLICFYNLYHYICIPMEDCRKFGNYTSE